MMDYYLPGFTEHMRQSIAPYQGYAEGGRVTFGEPGFMDSPAMFLDPFGQQQTYYAPTPQQSFAVNPAMPTDGAGYSTAGFINSNAQPYSLAEIQAAAAAYQQQEQAKTAERTAMSTGLADYIRQQAALGNEVASTDMSVGGGGSIGGALNFGFGAPSFDPANPGGTTGQVFRFDTGSQVGVPDEAGNVQYRNAAPVVFQPGQNYVLTDAKGENVLGRASTPEQMKALAEATSGGKLPYGFQVFQGDDSGNFTQGKQLFGKADPRADGLMGAFVNYGLPLATAFIPGVGLAGAIALAGASAGAGKLMTGYTPGDALKSAAISAATAGLIKGTGLDKVIGGISGGALSGIDPSTGLSNAFSNALATPLTSSALGSAGNAALASAATSGLGSALSSALPEIVVTGTRGALPGLLSGAATSAIGSGLSGLGQSLVAPKLEPFNPQMSDASLAVNPVQPIAPSPYTVMPGDSPLINVTANAPSPFPASMYGLGNIGQMALDLAANPPAGTPEQAQTPPDEEKVVTGTKEPPSFLNALPLPFSVVPPIAPVEVPNFSALPPDDEIVVTAPRNQLPQFEGPLVSGLETLGGLTAGQALNSAPPPTTEDEIVVTAPRNQLPQFGSAISSGLADGLTGLNDGIANQPPETAADKYTTREKIVDALRLAGLTSSLLGGATGGGGGGRVPAGFGSLPPGFGAELPAANIPGLGVGQASAPRAPGELGAQGLGNPQDYYRYGYGPAQSFFNYVPQGAPNTSTAFTGYAEGGSVRGEATYDELSPEEKNFVDYHRRNLAVRPLERDGEMTTVYGGIDHVDGGEMLHPMYIHGKIQDREAALAFARDSGIKFPVYPDVTTAERREQTIHRDIIESDMRRYLSGDREFLKGYAEGGFAVQGAGDGRSDDIPAMLSDGEYVIDAETVALLGNGSNKAGAAALDGFRVNLRKHKGRELAKGGFSVKARSPKQYLAGGGK